MDAEQQQQQHQHQHELHAQQQQQSPRKAVVLVIGNPRAPELSELKQLPPGAEILAVAQTFLELAHLSDQQWASVNVVCKMGGGSISRLLPNSAPSSGGSGSNSTAAPAASTGTGDEAAAAAGDHSDSSNAGSSPGNDRAAAHIHRSNSSSVSLTQSLEEFWPKLINLDWLHTVTVGTEHLLTPALIDSSVTVTNARGVYSQSLAEFAMLACLYFAKQLPRFLAAQAARRWEMFQVEQLAGATLGIIGYGSIGRAVAEMAAGHQMRVIALRRQPQQSEEQQSDHRLAQVFPPSQLHHLLGLSDYVVMATPHNPDTHQLLDAAAIAAMKPSAVLVNVGRGKCVEEAALVAALQAGRIKGAALDVFEVEPLPPSSPLWGLPNVLISPHSAARTDRFMVDNMAVFADNLRRYVEGRPLRNVIDKRRGY